VGSLWGVSCITYVLRRKGGLELQFGSVDPFWGIKIAYYLKLSRGQAGDLSPTTYLSIRLWLIVGGNRVC
jgi:hypothetical protein